MGTIWIKEFLGGLDARRMSETAPGGVLLRGTDGHINRGGEFEKRWAFVEYATLPAGATKGLAAVNSGLVVFGRGSEPAGMPSNVAYQQLNDGDSDALARVDASDKYDGKLYVAATFADGSVSHFYDGVLVTEWFDGRSRFSFDVVGGMPTGEVSSITIGGVEVLGTPVAWDTDAATTANAVVDQVNLTGSDYEAAIVDNRVTLSAATPGAGPNGLAVVISTTDITVSPGSGAMAGGASVGGTFQPGTFVKTINRKMFSLSSTLVHFSGIDQPTHVNTDYIGAGFSDMSREASLEGDLSSLAVYGDKVAIFSPTNILIFYFDPDPDLTRKSQVLENTGTSYPQSVTQFGDADVFYLDESGIRSLRARDSSSAAATSDIGIPIDDLVISKLESLSAEDRTRIFGVIEPRNGRFWLVIKDTIYVLSYFPGSKISAWSAYMPGFDVDAVTVWRRRIYLRAGDKIFVYGGPATAPAYDATEAEVWLPYLDANKPTQEKNWTGVDAAVRGVWEMRVGFQPTDENASDKIGLFDRTTYNLGKVPAMGRSTHASVRLRSKGDGYARVGAVVLHYDDADEDTEDG